MARSKKEKEADKFIEGVSTGRIKKARNLSGIWRAAGYDTKEAFDAANVSDGWIARHLSMTAGEKAIVREAKMQSAIEAVEHFEATEGDWQEKIVANIEGFERKKEERVAQYLEDFEAPAKVDIDNLKNLASMQLALEVIQRTKLFQMAKPASEQVSKSSRDIYKSLGERERDLLQQVRLLQKSMGLDLPTRLEKSEQTTGVDRVQAIVAASKEFLKNEVVEIQHCGIRIAWLSAFFEEEPLFIRTKCPRCGEVVEYSNSEE